jgi:hypothetical protein
MEQPRRIQRSRAKGWRKPVPDAVWVGRPGKWGNPFEVKQYGQAGSVRLFSELIEADADMQASARTELRGRTLMCWCKLDQPCHADVLVEVANG